MRNSLRFLVIVVCALTMIALPSAADANQGGKQNVTQTTAVPQSRAVPDGDSTTADPQSIIFGEDAPSAVPFLVSIQTTGYARPSAGTSHHEALVAWNDQPLFGSLDRHSCTGTLIDAEWVLTAASCLHQPRTWCTPDGLCFADGFYEVEIEGVAVGPYALSAIASQDLIKVAETHIHPDWFWQFSNLAGESTRNNPSLNDHDLALIRLTQPVTGVAPVTLADADIVMPNGGWADIVGWGNTSSHGNNDVLQQASVPVHDDQACFDVYAWLSGDTTSSIADMPEIVCAGISYDNEEPEQVLLPSAHDLPVNACGSDRGGPLLLQTGSAGFVQLGVHTGGSCYYSSEYTQLTAARQAWIQATVANPNHTDRLFFDACLGDSMVLSADDPTVATWVLSDAWNPNVQATSVIIGPITAKGGSISILSPDTWRYTPPHPGFGADWFTYTVTTSADSHNGIVDLNIMTCYPASTPCNQYRSDSADRPAPTKSGPSSKGETTLRLQLECEVVEMVAQPHHVLINPNQAAVSLGALNLPDGWLAP